MFLWYLLGSIETVRCLHRIKRLGRFRIIKLHIGWDVLENFLEEVVCALFLKK